MPRENTRNKLDIEDVLEMTGPIRIRKPKEDSEPVKKPEAKPEMKTEDKPEKMEKNLSRTSRRSKKADAIKEEAAKEEAKAAAEAEKVTAEPKEELVEEPSFETEMPEDMPVFDEFEEEAAVVPKDTLTVTREAAPEPVFEEKTVAEAPLDEEPVFEKKTTKKAAVKPARKPRAKKKESVTEVKEEKTLDVSDVKDALDTLAENEHVSEEKPKLITDHEEPIELSRTRRRKNRISKGDDSLKIIKDAIPHWVHDSREDPDSITGIFYLPTCVCSKCGYHSTMEKKICPSCLSVMK